MKTNFQNRIITFLLFVLFSLFFQTSHANFIDDAFKTKPKYYLGMAYSVSPVDYSYGATWAMAPNFIVPCTTNYVKMVRFTDQSFWNDKGLAQLGDYAIAIGFTNTIFGKKGIHPFWGINSYNFKMTSLIGGIGLYDINRDDAKHINLTYDSFLNKTYMDFVIMF